MKIRFYSMFKYSQIGDYYCIFKQNFISAKLQPQNNKK